METLSQEPHIEASVVAQKKIEAGEFVDQRIQELLAEGKSILEAAKIVYESVKGHEYRYEQATAKLVELLNIEEEAKNRAIEMRRDYPVLAAYSIHLGNAGNIPAANDETFTQNTDDKYTVI